MNKWILLGLCLALTSCGVATVRELREAPAGVVSEHTLTALDTAYNKILERMGECWSMGLGVGPAVSGSQNRKENTAQVVMKASGMSGSEVFMVIDLAGTDSTAIKVFYAYEAMKGKAGMVRLWAEGALECEPIGS